MKKLMLLAILLLACGPPNPIPTTSPTPTVGSSPTPTTSPTSSPLTCVQPNDPNSHVYNPDRLQVIQPCISVTGTIDFIRHEKDGDYHIGLKLDPQYANLINSCNVTCLGGAEHGDLVVEPVCVLPVTQADAVSSCVGYHNPIQIAPVGSHVEMTGPLVKDLVHGWIELHSLQEVHVIP